MIRWFSFHNEGSQHSLFKLQHVQITNFERIIGVLNYWKGSQSCTLKGISTVANAFETIFCRYKSNRFLAIFWRGWFFLQEICGFWVIGQLENFKLDYNDLHCSYNAYIQIRLCVNSIVESNVKLTIRQISNRIYIILWRALDQCRHQNGRIIIINEGTQERKDDKKAASRK